jgi:two-component system, sensor histidine kinase and response regulator
MRTSLRRLLLGLTTLAIVLVTLGSLAFSVTDRIRVAKIRLAAQTHRLTRAATPLLVNALVARDLAAAEQTLRNVNSDLVWSEARLYDSTGRRLMLDASPAEAAGSDAPAWLKRLLPLELDEVRTVMAARPVAHAVLVVKPSSHALESEVWSEIRSTAVADSVLLITLVVVVNAILVYGLGPVRDLAERATRFEDGDLSVRMPPTHLAEIAPTVRAFNAMAGDLEKAMADLDVKEAANRRLAGIVEQSEEAILTVDLDGRVTSWNFGAQRLFGRSPVEMLGQPLAAVFAAPRGRPSAEQIGRVLVTRPPQREEIELHGSVGAPLVLSVSSSPLHDKDDAPAGHIVVVRDVTERKRTIAQLMRAKEAAEAGNRAKAEFLATMSHEIRTPMNGIMGMTELLLETDLTPEQREFAMLAKVSADALLKVIDDILDFSKIDAGRLELEVVDFRLRRTIGQSLKPLTLRAREKGLELIPAVHNDVPDALRGDPGRLRQVLVNLVGNAVKFTDGGQVVVGVEVAEERPGEVELHFTVADTGIGIPASKLEPIFGAFTQADSSTTRRYGGTGLGLAITKQLVELMGGRIWVESEEGRGSTFHFTARFGPGHGAATEPTSVDPARLRGLPVLAVDDNPTSRKILTDMLSQAGLALTVVDGGEAARRALEQAAAGGELPRVIITDHRLPGLDGFELARWIKADPALSKIPIVMVSSSGPSPSGPSPGAARTRESAIAAYVTRPATQDELLEAIEAALAPAPRTVADPSPATRTRRRLHVLLAEDNAVNQKMAVHMLQRQGHSVVVATTGRAVLAALEAEAFDLVLMDIQMPEMDGLEATAAIRSREAEIKRGTQQASAKGSFGRYHRTGRIPIVALTAHAIAGYDAKCLAAGMDAHLAKPVTAEAVAAVIGRIMEDEPDSVVKRSDPPLDLAIARATTDGDDDLLAEIARLFAQDGPRRLADLKDALDTADVARVERTAHTLKGVLGTFGAEAARRLAAELETLAHEQRFVEGRSVLTALETEVARMTQFFAEQGWTRTEGG